MGLLYTVKIWSRTTCLCLCLFAVVVVVVVVVDVAVVLAVVFAVFVVDGVTVVDGIGGRDRSAVAVCVVGTLVLCPIVSDIRNDVNTNHRRNRTKNTPSSINFHLSSPQVAWTRMTAGIPSPSSLSMELIQVEGCELTIFPSRKYQILGSKCHSIPKLQFILETPKLPKFMPAVFAAETAPPQSIH